MSNNLELEQGIEEVMNYKGPILCEILMPSNQLLVPRVQSKKDSEGKITSTSIENMFPFLPDEEMDAIMK